MASPVTFEDTLRIHDQAMMNWLSNLTVDYGTGNSLFPYDTPKNAVPIIAVMASPDRAAAAISMQLVSMGWLTEAEAKRLIPEGARMEQMPLPAVSIVRGAPEQQAELRGVPKYLRSPAGQLDPRTSKPYIYPFPAHYRIPYTLSFWCSKRYTEAFMLEWIMAQLGPLGMGDNECLIPVVHKAPFPTVNQSLKFTGLSDHSELEGYTTRYLRSDAQFLLRAWFVKAPVTNWGGVVP